MGQFEEPLTLFVRLGYRPTLEAEAFASLARRDRVHCRRALCRLAEELRTDSARQGEGEIVTQLLIDVLHRLNRRLHPDPREQDHYQAERLAIIESLGPCREAGRARRRFLSLVDRLLRPESPREATTNPLVARAIRHIEVRYRERVSLSAVAESLAVSPSHLSRLFRRETGMTLTCYVQRVRLRHALALLADSGRTCSEVAYQVGYQNYRDFYRNVVKYENVSPRELRRRLERGSPPASGRLQREAGTS